MKLRFLGSKNSSKFKQSSLKVEELVNKQQYVTQISMEPAKEKN